MCACVYLICWTLLVMSMSVPVSNSALFLHSVNVGQNCDQIAVESEDILLFLTGQTPNFTSLTPFPAMPIHFLAKLDFKK